MASRRAWTDPVVETSDPLRLACPTLSRQGRAVGIALPSALPHPAPPRTTRNLATRATPISSVCTP